MCTVHGHVQVHAHVHVHLHVNVHEDRRMRIGKNNKSIPDFRMCMCMCMCSSMFMCMCASLGNKSADSLEWLLPSKNGPLRDWKKWQTQFRTYNPPARFCIGNVHIYNEHYTKTYSLEGTTGSRSRRGPLWHEGAHSGTKGPARPPSPPPPPPPRPPLCLQK